MSSEAKAFYDEQLAGDQYAQYQKADKHPFYCELKKFTETYGLSDKRCLEIGCGRGVFQDIVRDYVGIDISNSASRYIHKAFCQCSATKLPFKHNEFDAIWSYAVLEHIHDPELALEEMRRVLKNKGLLLLAPAWFCRSWAAKGYPIRPFSDLSLKGKINKASIHIRRSVVLRAAYILPRRIVRFVRYLTSKEDLTFNFKELVPNYYHYWMPDSDAVNSMDPYEAILWFVSRGDFCINYPNLLRQIFVRTGPLVFRISKSK
jgi:SAM-dependent methyltransferase